MSHLLKKIGFGGGCHWCTEAVFVSLRGVSKVQQGWVASIPPNDAFSEAVIVTYNPTIITLKELVEIHLHTHSSTVNHSMRHKYRSAVYWMDMNDEQAAKEAIATLQPDFEQPIITQVLPFGSFRENIPEQLNYYYSGPEKPFCKLYINPKLQLLRQRFGKLANMNAPSTVEQ